MIDRIPLTLHYSGLRHLDLVIEAVVEKMEIKAVLKETERRSVRAVC